MRKLTAIIASFALTFLVACSGPMAGPTVDVTGTWITATTLSNSAVYRLVQSGSTVSGSFTGYRQSTTCGDLSGNVGGNQLTFTVVMTNENCPNAGTVVIPPGVPVRATFSGTVRGNTFSGSATVTALGESETQPITLRRVQ